jgi:5-methylcytosine-specific restriction enzyme subunit McrC
MPNMNEFSADSRTLVELSEWESAIVSNAQLRPEDRVLAEQLGNLNRLGIEELRTGIRVHATSWVGSIRLSSLDVRVLPKLAGGTSYVADMLTFCRGVGRLKRTSGDQTLQTDRSHNLLNLLALLLAEAVERIVRDGLLTSYVARTEDLKGLRGRIQIRDQVLRHFGRSDIVSCSFDELEYDIDDNRILGAALRACMFRVESPSLRQRLRHLSDYFDAVCDIDALDLAEVRNGIAYDRQNSRYRGAHTLALAILDGLGVQDILAETGSLRSFAFLLDMNTLFEEFVTRLIDRMFPKPDFRVEPQARDRSVIWNADTNSSYKSIRPDLLLYDMRYAAILPVDAKYKLYDSHDLTSSDIYQSLLYAQAFHRIKEQAHAIPVAILVFPSRLDTWSVTRVHLRRSKEIATVELAVVGLPLRQTLKALGSNPPELPLELRNILSSRLRKVDVGSTRG